MSRLTDFYRGNATDHEGRTLADLWAYSDDEMEMYHDFIQWMFPLRELSRFNPEAPLVENADVAEFKNEPQLRMNLIKSLDRFLAFLGLARENGKVVPGPDYQTKKIVWAGPDHNWLRVTRVLHCLRIFGFDAEALALFERLQEINSEEGSGITAETYRYWQAAAHGNPSE